MSHPSAASRRWGLVGLAVVGYLRALDAPFVWDDLPHIVGNAALTSPTGPWAWLHAGTQETRPLLNLSFALNHALVGLAPPLWHGVNIALHALVAVLVAQVLQALFLRTPWAATQPQRAADAAWLGAAWFAVQPLATEAVTYVNSRSVLLACAGMWLAWRGVQRARAEREAGRDGRRAWAAAAAWWALALLAKEMAIVLPALIWWADAVLPSADAARAVSASGWRRLLPQRDVVALLPVAGLVPLLFAWMRSPHQSHIGWQVADPVQSALVQPWIVGRLVGLALVPIGQNIDHDVDVASLADPALWLAWAAWGLAAFAAWRLRRVRPEALLAFGALWIVMAPTNSVVPFYDPICERHLYPGLFALAIVVGPGLDAARQGLGRRVGRPGAGRWLVAALLLALVGLTVARNEVWRDPVALWTDAALGSPAKARPAAQLGAHLAQQGRLDEARPWLERAVRQQPDGRVWRENLGLLYRMQGQPERELALWRARLVQAPQDADARSAVARIERRLDRARTRKAAPATR